MHSPLFTRTILGAAALLACAAAQAVVVNVPDSRLDDAPVGLSYTYTALDAAATSMTAQASAAGLLNSIGSGQFQGLWFGGNQGSATYTFSFSAPIRYFDFRANAMSTFGSNVETIGGFVLNTAAVPSYVFTGLGNTAWDGSTVTAGPADNGDFRLAVSVAPGQSFTQISFFHFQSGSPNGSVVRDLNYELATNVPEPETYALMLLGLGLVGVVARRRNC